MDWDASGFRKRLAREVDSFNKAGAAALCRELITHLSQSDEPYPLEEATRILQLLRRKRLFELMQQVADALIQTGQDAPPVRRQYAQSLIDQDNFTAALAVLDALIADLDLLIGRTALGSDEQSEALGLKGRAYKQLYINAQNPSLKRTQENLNHAVNCYLAAYAFPHEKTDYLWHGINVLALLARARRDQLDIKVEGFHAQEAATDLAVSILGTIAEKDADQRAEHWDFATAAEACVALDRPEDALFWLGKYLRSDYADAFELASTLRQFETVWQLDMTSALGRMLLPPLRAELLKRQGGELEISVEELVRGKLEALPDRESYEKVLGDDSYQTYEWYKIGEARCRAVARIGRGVSKGLGTGFLIKGTELSAKFGKEPVLVTNAHVISDDPEVVSKYGSLRSHEAVVTFELLGKQKYRVSELLWSSPPHEMDTTVVRLDRRVADTDLYPVARALPLVRSSERVYIIGHPAGGTLSLSLQDNALIDHQDPPGFMHYRTPTVGGSSGSPVFNRDWDLIGLHHKGGILARLNGKGGTYEANEGVWIGAISSAIAKAGATPGKETPAGKRRGKRRAS
ncbi:MAG TPA: serine protease [Pyrinomonadaceae bacterium]|nr:serine protease [Pyrinomonadaceae bacterium]